MAAHDIGLFVDSRLLCAILLCAALGIFPAAIFVSASITELGGLTIALDAEHITGMGAVAVATGVGPVAVVDINMTVAL